MNTNELTFNELSASDFIPNDWGQIDISAYTLYADDEEVCFKLVLWSLQNKFANLVKSYFEHLNFGINDQGTFNKLKTYKLGLEVLNRYNPRDIVGDTTDYNVITYSTILDILQVLNNKY